MRTRRAREEVLVPVHKGTVAELLVTNALILESEGRLKVFRPWPDDHGVDFRVAWRGAPFSVELQVKADFAGPIGNAFHFIIDLADIPRRKRQFFVLACAVDVAAGRLRPQLFLIPGSAFPRATAARRMFRWSPPVMSRRPSKWDPFRVDLEDLGRSVEEVLARVGRRGARPRGRQARRGLPPFTQGFVTENALIVAASLGSEGRLCAFRPVADVVGIDLVFHELEGLVGVAAQVKGEFVKRDGDAVAAQIDPRTFRARDDRLLVVAPYVPSEMRLAKTAWVMTTKEFAERAKQRAGLLEFYGSPGAGATDRFVPFRCGLDELAARLEACVAARKTAGPAARLPTGKRGRAQGTLAGHRRKA